MSEDKIINELTKIKGLNKKFAIKLYRAGINSIKKLGGTNPDELTRSTGINKKQLTTWIILARAQERKKFIEVDAAAEELSQLVEIKIDEAKRLVSAGVMSIDDLAEESSDLLSEDTGYSVDSINKWIKKAKEIKKLPPEKRKIVIAPSEEVVTGSKLSGAFLGSSSGFNNIYNSSSFGGGFAFVLLTSIFLCLYLSMSQATIGDWSITQLWDLTQIKIVFELSGMQITWYPIVFIGGLVIIIAVWLALGKAVSSARSLEFKGTSAVLGYAMAPGIFIGIVIAGKFLPQLHDFSMLIGGQELFLLTIMLGIFGVWAVIVFIRGLAFSPSENLGVEPTTAKIPETFVTTTSPTATPAIQLAEEQPFTAPTTVPTVPTVPPTPAQVPLSPITPTPAPVAPVRSGPLNLSEFGAIIDPNSLAALHNAGFQTSLDLLRASSQDIATKTGIQQSKIIIWRIISDLLRISGMSLEYALILTKSGVRSVKHLSKINENALRVQVLDTISKENITTTISAQMLSDWINKSKAI